MRFYDCSSMQQSVKDALSKRLGGTTPEHFVHSLISSLQIVDDALYEAEYTQKTETFAEEHDALEQVIARFRRILETDKNRES
jgi:hypothetical protein